MLVVYHNIYDAWIFPGGHANGEEHLLSVAVREVEEATGDNIVDFIRPVHKRLIEKLNVKESTIVSSFFNNYFKWIVNTLLDNFYKDNCNL